MKRYLALFMVVVLTLVTFAGCGGGTSGGSVKAIDLRMNISTAESSTWYLGAVRFGDLIKERTGGKYIVSVYANEQLSNGNQAKGIEMVQTGDTDVDIHSTIVWSAIDQKLTVVSMPWLMTSYEQVDEMFADGAAPGEAVKQILRDGGIVPLAFGEAGFRQILNNERAIVTPEDLKGLKIRVPGIAMYIDLYTQLGADPTAINYGETFTALQQGAVDGLENPLDLLVNNKFIEVGKYLTMWNYSYDLPVLSVSKKLWDSLSEEEKAIFHQSAVEAMDYQKEEARKVNDSYLEDVKKIVEVTELTEAQMDRLKEAAAPVYETYRDEIGDELYAVFGYKG